MKNRGFKSYQGLRCGSVLGSKPVLTLTEVLNLLLHMYRIRSNYGTRDLILKGCLNLKLR